MESDTIASRPLHPALLRAIDDLGFDEPTPIQRAGIPPALAGRDVLACAMTGSGKTAAFLLPILQRLLDRPSGTTRGLVLTPTRELAAQIVEHFDALARHTRLRAAAVYGGVGMGPQERAFRTGVDLLVACPGRLLDHFRQPYARLAGLEVLVLDEADRMLDMGFLPDVRRVLRHLPRVAQTLFYSATLPRPIVELSGQLLNDPVAIDVQRPSLPAEGVTQALWPVREELKRYLLLELLERGELDDALVFTRTKHRANRLAEFLRRAGVDADRIHGNRSQAQRTRTLASFKRGDTRVLVATDIAARGIDVEALSHVVNFDVPNLPEDYIHRVGRTARAAATGDAFTFVSPQEEGLVRSIERAVGRRLPRRSLEGFDYDGRPTERFEVPIRERLAQARGRGKVGGHRSGREARPERPPRRAAERVAERAAEPPAPGRPARSLRTGRPSTAPGSRLARRRGRLA